MVGRDPDLIYQKPGTSAFSLRTISSDIPRAGKNFSLAFHSNHEPVVDGARVDATGLCMVRGNDTCRPACNTRIEVGKPVD